MSKISIAESIFVLHEKRIRVVEEINLEKYPKIEITTFKRE